MPSSVNVPSSRLRLGGHDPGSLFVDEGRGLHLVRGPALAWRPVSAVALGALTLLLVVANRYGFHRDELYFLEAGQHLALGYVDQPPLTPALARLQLALFGASPWSVRVLSAGTVGVVAFLAALLARELGGGRRPQVWSAVAISGAGFVLAVGHLLSTSTFDFAFWLALIVIVARLLRTGDPRWWVVYGAVAGVALWNKQLPVLLAVAVLVALVGARRWEVLAPRWLVLGGALALVLASPTLWWQAVHGWPQLQMAAALSERTGGESRATLLPLQLVLLGPVLIPAAIAGIRWLRGAGRTFAPLGWAYVAALVLTFVSGGRPYYPLPLAAVLVVAGMVALDQQDLGERGRARLLTVHVVASAVIALPLLPPDILVRTPIPALNDTLIESIGWPELAAQVAVVVERLPDDEREDVVLLTGSYGEAGALDRYGPALGLPQPYSGHNSYWDWRRPVDDHAAVVAIRLPVSVLQPYFGSCREVDQVRFDPPVDNEVQGAPIVICRDLQGTWEEIWPQLRHLD
jgi:4-amino-4-deoxy-L-arabinose transferase-like glycosyltransferase